MLFFLCLAEIVPREEFRRQHNVGPLLCGLAHTLRHAVDIVLHIV